jgi:hypothetical protein
MRHFGEEDWADFARQVVPPERRAEMQRHLNQGCAKCSKSVRLWQRVQETAGREAFYQPPASTVRYVKGSYALHRPKAAKSRAKRFARLIRDSFREPLLTGTRTIGASPRQLLYKLGQILVDVRMELQAGSDRLSLVGQVYQSGQPQTAMQDISVLAVSPEGELARTRTNRFGEFHLELDSRGSTSFVLSVVAGEAKEILIPIPLGAERGRWPWRAR